MARAQSWRPPKSGSLRKPPLATLADEASFRDVLLSVASPKLQSPVPAPLAEKRPVVIIGAGSIIQDGHGPAYQKLGLELLGIYDPNQNKADTTRQTFGIQARYEDLKQAAELGAERGAVFDIAVPPDAILETLAQLPERAAVLLQKPLGKNLEQAQAIAQLCRDRQLVAAVNFQLPLSPQIVAAVSAYQVGAIGPLKRAEVILDLKTEWSKWGFVFAEPRIEVLLHSIHYLSLAAFYFGRPDNLQSTQAGDPSHPVLKDRDICSETSLGYSKLEFSIDCNHLSDKPRSEWRSELILEGEYGRIVAAISDNLDYPSGVDDTLRIEHQQFGRHQVPLIGNRFPFAFAASMYELQRAAVAPESEPANDLEFAVMVMELCEACYASNAKRGPVSI
jgi:predicted dehydrogenase